MGTEVIPLQKMHVFDNDPTSASKPLTYVLSAIGYMIQLKSLLRKMSWVQILGKRQKSMMGKMCLDSPHNGQSIS